VERVSSEVHLVLYILASFLIKLAGNWPAYLNSCYFLKINNQYPKIEEHPFLKPCTVKQQIPHPSSQQPLSWSQEADRIGSQRTTLTKRPLKRRCWPRAIPSPGPPCPWMKSLLEDKGQGCPCGISIQELLHQATAALSPPDLGSHPRVGKLQEGQSP
jgi:hypothetical protein